MISGQAVCVPGTQEDLIQGLLFLIQTQERAEGNGDEKRSVIRKVGFDSHRNGCEWKRMQAFCKRQAHLLALPLPTSPISSSPLRDIGDAQWNCMCIRVFGIITAGMRPLWMLWGKRNLIYTNRILYACSSMDPAFPFISLQEALIFRCSSPRASHLYILYPYLSVYCFYPLVYKKTLGSSVYNS